MSKIVIAVNAMITDPGGITNVRRYQDEYFFLYKGKYKWSMAQHEGDYYLRYYPGENPIDELATIPPYDRGSMVVYSTEDLKAREAFATFAELYLRLKEKLYGVNEVLDDIIGE